MRQSLGDAWRNPLVLAIMAAALAAFGNGVVSYVGARQQTLLEASKAESARILEMIKTGDTEQAARNLSFLADTGLVTNDEVRSKLARFLADRTLQNSPRLPIEQTPGPAFLTRQEKQELLGGPQVHFG